MHSGPGSLAQHNLPPGPATLAQQTHNITCAPSRVSVFDRLEMPETSNTSVFDRLEWPSKQTEQHRPSRCSRCLLVTHTRQQCTNRIRCLKCLRPGHIKRDCDFFEPTTVNHGEALEKAITQKWVPKINIDPPPKQDIINIRKEKDCLDLNLSLALGHEVNNHNSQASFDLNHEPDMGLNSLPTRVDPLPISLSFSLGNSGGIANLADLTRQNEGRGAFISDQRFPAAASSPTAPNPSTSLAPPRPHPLMAAYEVDPAPFLPGRYTAVEVANRPPVCRYHVSSPVPAMHEDIAIVTIVPAPNGQIPFAQVRAFIRSFVEDYLHFSLDIIQKCPLGQAYIQLDSSADRDWLVDCSPHNF